MKRKKKRTFNHGTGKFEESTPMGEDATTFWKRKLGMGDGKKGSVEISKDVNVGDSTVRRYWVSWARQGIMESLRVRGGERYKKSFELEDFGIEVPPIKTQMETEESEHPMKAEQREKQ